MISRLGSVLHGVFRRTAPDPFILAVLLTLLTALLATVFGFRSPDGSSPPMLERASRVLDAWGTNGGVWTILAFAMQMCLILVTGHALAASGPIRAAMDRIAGVPTTAAQAASWVALWACMTAVVNWGLGLIVGAILARDVGRAMGRRGVPVQYPLLAAAGYTGLMVWHGGLSGSAPLTMTTVENAAKVLPARVLERLSANGGVLIGLDRTLGSTLNLVVTGGLLVLTPAMFFLLTPKRDSDVRSVERFLPPKPAVSDAGSRGDRPGPIPDWLERSPVVVWILAAALLVSLWRFGRLKGLGAIGPNEVNAAMLALGLILHGSARSYLAAVEEAARGCAGIILQFPLYAGIMAMMQGSGLVARIAEGFAAAGGERATPLLSFLSASVVNLFVPSGGGQWAVQGPIALQSGLDAGIDPAKMVMTVAYGDQLTNMLQPFWALPLLAITGVKARDIVGYTAVVMMAGGAWISLCLLVL